MYIQEYIKEFTKKDYKKVTIKVRDKRKTYHVVESIVKLKGIGEVKLIISKKGVNDKNPKYISTDTTLSKREVLKIYENRWNIETAPPGGTSFCTRGFRLRGLDG